MKIWRLNVKETQITSCIHNKMFAISNKPRNPEIEKGDLLLLQLVLMDAKKFGKESRIEYVLIFDHYEFDHDGTISRHFWPEAGKAWSWIIYCSEIIPTIPFSLEKLNLYQNYSGQMNPVFIQKQDMNKILPYILRIGKTDEIAKKIQRVVEEKPGQENYLLWAVIQNNDRIVEDSPDQVNWTTIPEQKIIKRNPELPILLKKLYHYTCQICKTEFEGKYGVPYSETHHIIWLARGGVDHSNNLIVVCPNHHRIIHEAKPKFDRNNFRYIYSNGYQESLVLKDHLKNTDLMLKIEKWAKERYDNIQKEKVNFDE